MSKPRHAYRLSIASIRDYMLGQATVLDQAVTLINFKTRNSWTVFSDGRWL